MEMTKRCSSSFNAQRWYLSYCQEWKHNFMMWEKPPADVIHCVFIFFLSQNTPPPTHTHTHTHTHTYTHTKCLLLYKRLKMDDINYDLNSFAFQGAIRPMTNLLTRAWVFRRNDVIKISKSVMKSNHNHNTKKKKTFRSLSLSPRLDCFWGQTQHVWLCIIARMIEHPL